VANIHTNFAYAYLYTGITAAATSLTTRTGQGARFGSGTWYGVIWDTYYKNASEAYQNSCAEIVLATSNGVSDTLTLTRAQQSTTARAFNRAGRTYAIMLVTVGADFAASSASIEYSASVSGTAGSNTITYASAFSDATYALMVRCQNSSGEWIIPTSISQTAGGFTCVLPEAGTIHYIAVAT